jgi:CubicO group peptidase (beta-lactamase class C family)
MEEAMLQSPQMMLNVSKIEQHIQHYVDSDYILGLAVAIVQPDEIIYTHGFGRTGVEDQSITVTPDTLFAYGSISKNICAALVMRLVEQGKLDLDKPALKLLPGFSFSDAELGQKITLRHLLSHTTGLPAAGKDWGPRDRDALKRFVREEIPHYSFLLEPGRVHLYSSTVMCMAGYLAEAATGKYYDDLAQELVFDPLEMDRSTFDHAVAMTYPTALPHELDTTGQPRTIHRMTANASGHPSSFCFGSTLNLANLAMMYLNQGQFKGHTFLAPTSLEQMFTPYGRRYIEGASHPFAHISADYGLCFELGSYKGVHVVRHGGTTLSYNCRFDLFPDEGIGLVLQTNFSDEEKLSELIVYLYDQILGLPSRGIVSVPPPQPIDLNSVEQAKYVGTYVNIEFGILAKVSQEQNQLKLEYHDELVPLIAFDQDRYYCQLGSGLRIPVTFLPETSGAVQHVMVRGRPYHRLKLEPTFEPKPELWERYAGLYQDPNNRDEEAVFRVYLNQERELMLSRHGLEVSCQPLNNSCFISQHGFIEFETHDGAPPTLVWGKATRYQSVK